VSNGLGILELTMTDMLVAVCKAVLVALFFMHLKFDWFKVYVMIVPAVILGTVLICTLLPDVTFQHSIKWNWILDTFDGQ